MTKFFNETNFKIGIVVMIITGMYFMGKHERANSEFNINDFSVINNKNKPLSKLK